MGPDDDVDLAIGERLQDLRLLFSRSQARQLGDLHREGQHSLSEGLVMLLGQNRGRSQNRDLLAAHDGLEGSAQCHLGLTKAYIAYNQPVHRAIAFHIRLYSFDGSELVRGFDIREGCFHIGLPIGVRGEGGAAGSFAFGIELQQLASNILHIPLGLALGTLPIGSAEPRNGRLDFARTHVARNAIGLVGGDEEHILGGVNELQVIAFHLPNAHAFDAVEARDPVLDMYHIIAGGIVGEEVCFAARGSLASLPAPVGHAPTEELPIGDQQKLAIWKTIGRVFRSSRSIAQNRFNLV